MGAGQRGSLSKVLIRGLGSKAWFAGPDRRLVGLAVSARESTKSRTIKSLLEKSSRVKLGPRGKRARLLVLLETARSMAAVVAGQPSMQCAEFAGSRESSVRVVVQDRFPVSRFR
jgi:hypothetical protein